jgi:hypothetical protein
MFQGDPQFPIEIVQGATFDLPVFYEDETESPINLTGYTAKMQVRYTPDDTDNPIIALTSGTGGGITISGTLGLVEAVIPYTVTSTLSDTFIGYYDLFIYSPTGVADRILFGPAKVLPRVTK